jgi:hypothetical protein
MHRAVHDRLVKINIAVPDFEVKAAIGIGANPGLVADRRTLAAEIRQGHQITGITFLTFGETDLFHGVLLPTEIIGLSALIIL